MTRYVWYALDVLVIAANLYLIDRSGLPPATHVVAALLLGVTLGWALQWEYRYQRERARRLAAQEWRAAAKRQHDETVARIRQRLDDGRREGQA